MNFFSRRSLSRSLSSFRAPCAIIYVALSKHRNSKRLFSCGPRTRNIIPLHFAFNVISAPKKFSTRALRSSSSFFALSGFSLRGMYRLTGPPVHFHLRFHISSKRDRDRFNYRTISSLVRIRLCSEVQISTFFLLVLPSRI